MFHGRQRFKFVERDEAGEFEQAGGEAVIGRAGVVAGFFRGVNPHNPFYYVFANIDDAIDRLRQLTAEAGRDPKSVGVTMRFPRYGGAAAKAGDGERKLFSGSSAEIAGDIKDLAKIGVGCIDTGFDGGTVPEILAAMKRFQGEVLSKV